MKEARERLVNGFFEHLNLEQLDANLFRSLADDHGASRIFGGQVIGQALIAAGLTVEDRPCHSLHTYFLRAGDPTLPIDYEVDRIRDGRSFTTRQVIAKQQGKAILSMSASFQAFEQGLEHQIEMPNVPGPDELPSSQQLLEQQLINFPEVDEKFLYMAHGARPVEFRQVQDFNYFKPEKMPALRHIWYRSNKTLGNELLKHQSLLAYASDLGILTTSTMPHGKSFMTGLELSSIDHSMWFHRPVNIDEWILIEMESTVAAGSRGFTSANIFTQDGMLVGSATQEGLIRDTK